MRDIIKRFSEKANQLGHRSCFYPGLTHEEIQLFQKRFVEKFGIQIPHLMLEFYQYFNGGFFAAKSWSEESMTNSDDFGDIWWNSNTFLSLDEILSDDWFDSQEIYEETGRLFFPIIHTEFQEIFVIEVGEEVVRDAFHEMLFCPEDWGIVYPSFEKLLEAYIEQEGAIEVIGEL